MSVSSPMLRVMVSMMEASDGVYSPVSYSPEEDAYTGVSACPGVSKLERMGIISVLDARPGALGDELTIRIESRADFLAGFYDGALAHRNGQDLYYADYSPHPFAFTCGWQHATQRAKRNLAPYDASRGYVCHGFACEDTGEIHKQ